MSDDLFTTTTVETEASSFWQAASLVLYLLALLLALCSPAIVAGVWRWGM